MLIKVSKQGFLRKSWSAGMDILKGKNVERAIAKKQHLTTQVSNRMSNAKLDKNKGESALNRFQDLANKHDTKIRRERAKTTITRAGMFGGIVGGTLHGANDVAQRKENSQFAQYKQANAAIEYSNIPVDTSKPTSQSPTDGMDYYDYQEWVAAETGNAPDRSNLPIMGEDENNAPLKIAHDLGCDLFVVNAIEEYLGKREIVKEAGLPTEEAIDAAGDLTKSKGAQSVSKKLSDRLKNTKIMRNGSKLLGAAMIGAAGYGAARAATNAYESRPNFRHSWYE